MYLNDENNTKKIKKALASLGESGLKTDAADLIKLLKLIGGADPLQGENKSILEQILTNPALSPTLSYKTHGIDFKNDYLKLACKDKNISLFELDKTK